MLRTVPVLLVLLLGSVTSIHAGEGRIEINQAKADAGGINGSLALDPPGLPVIITQPGSYVLTGDLTTGSLSTSVLQVQVADVSIDLNRFAIVFLGFIQLVQIHKHSSQGV